MAFPSAHKLGPVVQPDPDSPLLSSVIVGGDAVPLGGVKPFHRDEGVLGMGWGDLFNGDEALGGGD